MRPLPPLERWLPPCARMREPPDHSTPGNMGARTPCASSAWQAVAYDAALWLASVMSDAVLLLNSSDAFTGGLLCASPAPIVGFFGVCRREDPRGLDFCVFSVVVSFIETFLPAWNCTAERARIDTSSVRILLAYKDISAAPGASHVGLGVTALNCGRVLKGAGLDARPWPVYDGYALEAHLHANAGITHVVMFAPWVDTPFLRGLTARWPRVQFCVACHSNIGFLSADRWACKVIAEQADLEKDRLNFTLAGNCATFCNAIEGAYGQPVTLLPNLFETPAAPPPASPYVAGTVRLGLFGATRVLKNMPSGVIAACILARTLDADVQLHINSGRTEHGDGVIEACRNLLASAPRVSLVTVPWQTWPQFSRTIARMHLCLQPSFTESFNNVTADAILAGVPSAVSTAIDWTPRDWQADADDPVQLAEVALRLLRDKTAPTRGLNALRTHVADGLDYWRAWLKLPRTFGERLARALAA